jgi:hypothetical protein
MVGRLATSSSGAAARLDHGGGPSRLFFGHVATVHMDRRGRRVVMGGGAAGSTQKYRAEKIFIYFYKHHLHCR